VALLSRAIAITFKSLNHRKTLSEVSKILCFKLLARLLFIDAVAAHKVLQFPETVKQSQVHGCFITLVGDVMGLLQKYEWDPAYYWFFHSVISHKIVREFLEERADFS